MIMTYVVRHGDTKLNDDGKFRGFIDVPLNTKGYAEARNLAKFFTEHSVGSIHSSDLSRASDTAGIIAKNLGLKVQTSSDLRPWNVGKLAGLDKKSNASVIEEHVKNPDKPLPGGESLNEFRERFGRKVRHITRNSKLPAMLVVHASGAHEIGNMVEGDPDAGDIRPGGVIEVNENEDGDPTMKVLRGAQEDSKGQASAS